MNTSIKERPQNNLEESTPRKRRKFGIIALIILFFKAVFLIFKFFKDNKNAVKLIKDAVKDTYQESQKWEPDLAITTKTGGIKTEAFIKCRNIQLLAANVGVKPNLIEFDLYFTTPKQHYYKAELMERLQEKRRIKKLDSARKRLKFDESERNSNCVEMMVMI